MREDGGDARPDLAAFDQGDMADLRPEDSGDGIERAGLERPGLNPELPQARPLSRGPGGGDHQGKKENLEKHASHFFEFLAPNISADFRDVNSLEAREHPSERRE